MRTQSPRTPPPSSYSHSPHCLPDISVHEIASRIGLHHPDESRTNTRRPSYISLLPPEILTEIFLFCIPDEQFPLPYTTEAPLLLTHVSSQWRSIAVSVPELWTALHINYKDPAEDIPATDIWLSRSGSKPLSLSIAIDFSEQPQQEILDALCRHSKRWKYVRFDFRHLLCPAMYTLDMALNDIPELSTFEFYARDVSNINIAPVTNLLSSAPKLREVTWVDDMADTNTLLQLPLGRLTKLALSLDHGTLDYLKVLNECYNLEHIRLTRPFSLAPQTHAPLFLPKLTSFNISSDVISPDMTGVLDLLILPNLQEVRIHGDIDKTGRSHPFGHDAHADTHQASNASAHFATGTWDPTPLLSLIHRSACSVTSLSVSLPMTEAALLMCLRGTSNSLVKLSVEGIPVGDMLMEALTCHLNADAAGAVRIDRDLLGDAISEVEGQDFHDEHEHCKVLCPNLEELTLDTRVGCSPGMLASMVESRLCKPKSSDNTHIEPSDDDIDALADVPCILKMINVVDGHKDIQRLKGLSVLSKTAGSISRRRGGLAVNIIPRKPTKSRTRGFLFRRKLCASR
ncbi:hypothetical protein BDN70DRAFT_996451 [Pholiota conissans]|uniref:F-box domain-containing protein n=1 Tax=Pholiota conissans TaxID=109636 RepID=A0A9P5YTA5_9AGAR|nr:hypothetical protein BDN70DRAFT_996451 [Pholiota conissans]